MEVVYSRLFQELGCQEAQQAGQQIGMNAVLCIYILVGNIVVKRSPQTCTTIVYLHTRVGIVVKRSPHKKISSNLHVSWSRTNKTNSEEFRQ